MELLSFINNRCLFAFLVLFCFNSEATTEKIQIYPLLGEVGTSPTIQNRLIKHVNIYKYDSKPFYQTNSPSTLLANKYLLLKYFELLSESNDEYLDVINNQEAVFENISKRLDDVSINKAVLDALGTAEWTSHITKVIANEKLEPSAAISSALKFLLERESIKKWLIKNMPLIEPHNYNFYVEIISGSVDLALEAIPLINGASSASITKAMQTKFSSFVGIPLAIWETGLKVGKAGNAMFGLAALFKAEDLKNIDTFAAIFLYDLVNNFSGDMNLLKAFIESHLISKTNLIIGKESVIGRDGIPVDSNNNIDAYEIELKTFYDVFYYYMVINNKNYLISDLSFMADESKIIFVKAARKALTYIEQYGNGGNFKIEAEYKLSLDSSNKIIKNLVVQKDRIRFNPLYFMPLLSDFKNDKAIRDFFHGPYIFPYKIAYKSPKFKVIADFIPATKLELINEYGPSITEPSQHHSMINLRASPEITLSVSYTNNRVDNVSQQSIKIAPFYIGYGAFDDLADGHQKPVVIDSFINFYNAGALSFNSYDWRFYPLYSASPKFLNHGIAYYVNASLPVWRIAALMYDYQNTNKQWLDLTKNSVTRDELYRFLVEFYQLRNLKVKRPFTLEESEWTNEGVILYQLGIIQADKQGQMNPSNKVTQIEFMVIAELLKELLA
jgi:hypothetical protein